MDIHSLPELPVLLLLLLKKKNQSSDIRAFNRFTFLLLKFVSEMYLLKQSCLFILL